MDEPITNEVMEVAAAIEGDIPSRVTGANRVFIRAVIARALMAAKAEERALAANFIEAKHDWPTGFITSALRGENDGYANWIAALSNSARTDG